jgi:LPXTG-motif cell wall-anchored protein
MKTAGIIILILGLAMTLYTGFTYVTKEKVADVGPIEVTKDKEHSANWSPYLGIGLIIIGGGIVVAGRKK